MESTDRCWETGAFTDDCICELCEHRDECSGYEDHEEEDQQLKEREASAYEST